MICGALSVLPDFYLFQTVSEPILQAGWEAEYLQKMEGVASSFPHNTCSRLAYDLSGKKAGEEITVSTMRRPERL